MKEHNFFIAINKLKLIVILCFFSATILKAQNPTFDWVVITGAATTFSGGYGVAHDALGNIYAAGRFTGTIDFDPGAGIANLTSAGALDIYVTKVDAAGNLAWAKRMGGTLDDYSFDVFVDEGGSVYATGAFSGTADFDPGAGTFNLTSFGFDDIFILKLDMNGNLAWARRMGSSSFDFGRSIAVSAAGNVITTGSFRGTVDFDPGAGISNLASTAGGNDIFISKLDASGNFVWAKRMGGNSNDIGYAVALDAAENVFTTGSFSTTADFDPGASVFNLIETGNSDIFISKLDGAGNFVWAKGMGGTSSDFGFGIQVDYAGNVYTTGYFESTTDFDPGAGIANLVSGGFNDAFISKLDANGNYLWAKGMAGTSDEESTSLAVDGYGNVYAAGSFESTVDFDPGPGTFNLTPTGSADGFVIKLDGSGDFVWAQAFEGLGGARPEGIDVDVYGSIYTTGYFNGTVDFDTGPGVSNVTAAGSNDTFIHKMRQILTPPTISSFAPTNGPVGTTVTITGTNFSPTPANNIVFFGATRATVTAATATQLTVIVPVGATYQPITVNVGGLIAYSAKPFTVTFPDGGTIDACSFAAKVNFTTGIFPLSVSIGDLDGDGKADLTVINNGSINVSVFRNTSSAAGSIRYAANVDFTTGTNPWPVSIGDLDEDGKLDLVVPNYSSNTVSVFHNTSSGAGSISYAAKIDFTTGTWPSSVSIGDLDGDGKVDLAVVNSGSNTISVFRNTSSGAGIISYAARVNFTTGTEPSSVSIGDLDGDGKADLAVANNNSNTVSVFRNTASGPGSISYAAKIDFTTGVFPFSVSNGDLDGDGKAELAVANYTSGTVSVFRNTSSGAGIISYAAKVDFTAGTNPRSVSIGDLDGDGKADLAVPNSGSSTVSVFRNMSSVGSISYATKVDFTTGATWSVSIGDLDGDGKADLAVANSGSNTVSVFRNTISSLLPTITSFNPTSAAIGTSITITGTNFSTTPANNSVTFINNITATVTASTATSITTTVPTGTTTGKISVTTNCVTVLSATNFTIATPQNFITQWNLATAGSGATQLSFGTATSGTVNYTWQEISPGSATGSSSWSGATLTITGLPVGATIRLQIAPTNFQRIIINNGADRNRLTQVENWDSVAWTSMQNAFYGCANLQVTATDVPNLLSVSDMSQMFRACANLNSPGNIGSWNTSAATSTYRMFYSASSFNQNIGAWNTAAITDMSEMFYGAAAFNQNIGAWNTGAVDNMYGMFYDASAFNQNIGTWNTAAVTDMEYMFYGAAAFNQNISTWNTGAVNTMSEMFARASVFNQNIGSWNTGAVTTMFAMFERASSFNQDIGSWNTAAVTDFKSMFSGASAFNQSIGAWNTGAVTRMGFMFYDASTFNQNIGSWNTAAVTDMQYMFYNASAFNQNIGSWNTGAVTSMEQMFQRATAFNQNISTWNTGAVTSMFSMFDQASAFNQNIGAWTLKTGVTITLMLNNTGMDCNNYSATLIGWSANQSTPTGRTLGATGRQYGTNAVAARTNLTVAKGWTITGDTPSGAVCSSASIPTITNFTPTSGPIGTTVTITGTNFSTTPASNVVAFNGTTATVTASTTTSITTTVPTGATTGKITVTIASNTATSTIDFTVTVSVPNQPPVINTTTTSTTIGGVVSINLIELISDPDDNLVLGSLTIILPPASGASATLVNNVLEIDYTGVNFSGRDQLTIQVCDASGECTQQVLEIEVIGDIEIYNGISPNGDNKNDTWIIEYIDLFPDTKNNRVTIYNRWGDVVWEASKYDNTSVVFSGISKNGSELSTGSYFYKIEFEDGKETVTGFLSLKR